MTADGMLAAAAASTPDAPAVVDGATTLTYGQFDAAVRGAAAGLRERGIGRGDRVAVIGPLSAELHTGILAVLRSGAAFVPIDGGATTSWVEQIVEDAGATLIVVPDAATAGCLAELATPVVTAAHLVADVDAGTHGRDRGASPSHTSADLACIVYTSGSTSRPKGVLLPHAGLVNLAVAARDAMELGAADRLLQLAPIGFSASLEELFPPLLVGACLVVGGYPRVFPTTAELVRVLDRDGITVFELTTALWDELTDDLARGVLRLPEHVRLVVVGGDKPSPARLRDWAGVSTSLLQVYGPTETTATATYGSLDPAVPGYEAGPIGRAITDTTCRVLDRELRPVTPGAQGELHVAGAALAYGYEGRPAETAARFVPDAFGPPGSRLYRTGDLVHEGVDGALFFDGRVDSQMKVRGARIEPSAVEDAVAAHPAVRAVVAFSSNDQLCVAVVLRAGYGAEAVDEVRLQVAEHYPPYLRPDRYICVDEIPLTEHNKIDRTHLAELGRQPAPPPGAGVPVTWSATEARLRTIWEDVLAVPVTSPSDDFVGLGGNSLLLLRLISRISHELGVRLTHAEVRAIDSLAALARRIDAAGVVPPVAPGVGVVAVAPAADGGSGNGNGAAHGRRSLAAPSLQAFHFLRELEPASRAYNESWAFWVQGRLDPEDLRAAFAAVSGRHDVLRSSLRFEEGALWHHVDDEVAVDFAHVDAGLAPLPELLVAAATEEIDLSRAPLCRLRLYSIDGGSSVLQVVAHHAVVDAWTGGLLIGELDEQYRRLREGRGAGDDADPGADADQEPGPPQFRAHARRLQEALSGPEGVRLRTHWAATLRGLSPDPLPRLAPLPVRRPASRGRQLRRPLSPMLAESVLHAARAHRTTPFVVLLAAFYRLLAAETGQQDLHVVTPAANRDEAAALEVFGCTMNTVVLRCDLADPPDALDLVRRVDRVVREAIENAHLPFADAVSLARDGTSEPTATLVDNIGFGMEDLTATPSAFGGHRRGPNSYVHTGHSKAALGWRVWNHGDRFEVTADWRFETGLDVARVDQLFDRYEAAIAGLCRTAEAKAMTR
jgi:amino acid adenylation domain-containing protein